MTRFLYYVAPLTQDKWNILFQDQPRPFIYDSEEAAVKAAHKAAERSSRSRAKRRASWSRTRGVGGTRALMARKRVSAGRR